jgi:hypothetical protein
MAELYRKLAESRDRTGREATAENLLS